MYLLFEFVLNYLKIGLRNSLSQISSFLNLIGSQNIYTGVSSDYMVFFISIKLFDRVKKILSFLFVIFKLNSKNTSRMASRR